jgi:hypothetical protein
VVNKVRALGSWYTKGLDGGSHLRTQINSAPSLGALVGAIEDFFLAGEGSRLEGAVQPVARSL